MVGIEQHLATLLACALQNLIFAPAAHAIALALTHKQIQQQGVFEDGDVVTLQNLLDGKLRNPSTRGITTGVEDTTFMVSALQAQSQHTVHGIELHTFGNDLGYTVGTFVYKYLYRAILTQTTACYEGIGFMYLRVIVARGHSGYAALSIKRIALAQERFGNHRHAALCRRLIGGIQPGESATDDYIIKFTHLGCVMILQISSKNFRNTTFSTKKWHIRATFACSCPICISNDSSPKRERRCPIYIEHLPFIPQ